MPRGFCRRHWPAVEETLIRSHEVACTEKIAKWSFPSAGKEGRCAETSIRSGFHIVLELL
jgi:hypothetical protein